MGKAAFWRASLISSERPRGNMEAKDSCPLLSTISWSVRIGHKKIWKENILANYRPLVFWSVQIDHKNIWKGNILVNYNPLFFWLVQIDRGATRKWKTIARRPPVFFRTGQIGLEMIWKRKIDSRRAHFSGQFKPTMSKFQSDRLAYTTSAIFWSVQIDHKQLWK